jgi:hypothetical protein
MRRVLVLTCLWTVATLAGSAQMSEKEARQVLGEAGIELWPSDKKADPYSPPYSYIEMQSNQTFELYS